MKLDSKVGFSYITKTGVPKISFNIQKVMATYNFKLKIVVSNIELYKQILYI